MISLLKRLFITRVRRLIYEESQAIQDQKSNKYRYQAHKAQMELIELKGSFEAYKRKVESNEYLNNLEKALKNLQEEFKRYRQKR